VRLLAQELHGLLLLGQGVLRGVGVAQVHNLGGLQLNLRKQGRVGWQGRKTLT
jgi:hypothetical protein